jgi:hypothetical protein
MAPIGVIARGIDGLEAGRKQVAELRGNSLVIPAHVAH